MSDQWYAWKTSGTKEDKPSLLLPASLCGFLGYLTAPLTREILGPCVNLRASQSRPS
jgi:hypothetical protein